MTKSSAEQEYWQEQRRQIVEQDEARTQRWREAWDRVSTLTWTLFWVAVVAILGFGSMSLWNYCTSEDFALRSGYRQADHPVCGWVVNSRGWYDPGHDSSNRSSFVCVQPPQNTGGQP